MSAYRLSRRRIRHIAGVTGLDVTRAWSAGSHWVRLYVRLADGGHAHYRFHVRTHRLLAEPDPVHWPSCRLADAEAGWG